MRSGIQLLFIFCCISCATMSFAQAPASFKYQTLVRNSNGELLSEQAIVIGIGILQGSADGPKVYFEKQHVVSNNLGLVNMAIGEGTEKEGSLNAINWSEGSYFLKIEVNGETVGITQLLSVPYALYANAAGNQFSGDYNELTNKPALFSGDYSDLLNKPDSAFYTYTDPDPDPQNELQKLQLEDGMLSLSNGGGTLDIKDLLVLRSPGGKLWQVTVDDSGKLAAVEVDTNLVFDFDGNVYHKLKIGNQLWLKENLRVSHYNDGTPIPDGSGIGDYSQEVSPSYVFNYNDDPSLAEVYGKLYTWQTVIDSSGLCPSGWHVPSESDWMELFTGLGMSQEETGIICSLQSPVGARLKESGTAHWAEPNLADNSSGFSALGAGLRRRYDKEFLNLGEFGVFWSSREQDAQYAWYVHMYNDKDGVCWTYNFKNYGKSVRCTRNR